MSFRETGPESPEVTSIGMTRSASGSAVQYQHTENIRKTQSSATVDGAATRRSSKLSPKVTGMLVTAGVTLIPGIPAGYSIPVAIVAGLVTIYQLEKRRIRSEVVG